MRVKGCRYSKHNFVSSGKFYLKGDIEVLVLFCSKCGCKRELTIR